RGGRGAEEPVADAGGRGGGEGVQRGAGEWHGHGRPVGGRAGGWCTPGRAGGAAGRPAHHRRPPTGRMRPGGGGLVMYTFVLDETRQLTIPFGITDLASFRRWYESDEFPEEGRIWFIRGGVWADVTLKQLFSHNQVRTELAGVVGRLIKRERAG